MTKANPLGASLMSAPPLYPPERAAQAAWEHFGLAGRLTALTSERDVNYRLDTADGSFVLKLANPAVPPEVTAFQTRALLHLEPAGLPVPRLRRTRDGQTEVPLPEGVLRCLTYLDGQMMHRAAPSPALRRSVGEMAARLSSGLQGFDHPAAAHVLQWDLKHAAALRPLLADVPEDLQALAARALDRFDTDIAPYLAGLRWQVVHNDLNPHNIVVNPEGTDVTGILDFGDMVRTPLICDLAVAASYQIVAEAPVASLTEVAAAFHAALPLTRQEASVLCGLTETRWLTTLCIASHRARLYPQNAAYILRNLPQARAGLLAFAGLDRARATETLLTALRLT